MKKISSIEGDKSWPIRADRFVGVIDIMGFKDLVARNSQEYIYDLMQKIWIGRIQKEYLTNAGNDGKLFVRANMFSDTIFIFSRDASAKSQSRFVTFISLISKDLLLNKIPFKGAVSFGHMTVNNPQSIYFGQPLIDAFLLQEELNFYGIICHFTAEQKLREKCKLLFDYSCPFKNGISNHFCFFPLLEHGYAETFSQLETAVNDLRFNTSGAIRKYIDNTKKFINYAYKDWLPLQSSLKKYDEYEKLHS